MKHLLLILILIASNTGTVARQITINKGWLFQRVDKAAKVATISNQGSDWSSQFNVEHVSSSTEGLTVSADTLKAEFEALSRGAWQKVSLPHTPQIEPLTVIHQWQGVCYYTKDLTIDEKDANQKLFLEFQGAMHLADVWVNGKHMAQHAGGYTPFVVDISGMVSANRENKIVVRLDNRDNPLIPPGKPVSTLDFCYYGGLYRDVNLIVKPMVHITHPILADKTAGGGIFVTYPKVTSEQAQVEIQTEVANSQSATEQLLLKQTLYEWGKSGRGKKVANSQQNITVEGNQRQTIRQTLEVAQPKLWFPDSPKRYVLSSEVYKQNKLIDAEETKIGIRRYEMSKAKGLLINGKPYRLVGSNRHMEYPYIGNALSANAQYRDIYQIKSNGFNVVRLGHYPQDPSVLEACDELGLLAIEPIPGWQFYNKNPQFIALTMQSIRELIRRDRNHPCILTWETTLNESWPPNEWKDAAVKVAHEEYPGDQCFASGDAYGYEGFDVCYNDWEEGFHRPNTTSKPSFIREYYDYEFGGHFSTTRIGRKDGEKALIQNVWNAQWSHNRYRASYPQTMGDAVWSMYDYNRGCCDNICRSGIADLFRLPKYSLHFFRCQVAAGSPMPQGKMPYEVFATTDRGYDMSDTVQVFGNVDRVELRLNGKTLETRQPDHGKDTPYVTKPDGGNCKQLSYAPFTFMNVPNDRGVLQVIGYSQGKKVAQQTIRTPQECNHLQISYFESGRKASKNDLLIVYVQLLDKNNVLCLDNGAKVSLQAQGGTIVGPTTFETERGIASFLVKTEDEAKLTLHAVCGTMQSEKRINLTK